MIYSGGFKFSTVKISAHILESFLTSNFFHFFLRKDIIKEMEASADDYIGSFKEFSCQLVMQSCLLCSFVRCGASNQIEKKKEKKDVNIFDKIYNNKEKCVIISKTINNYLKGWCILYSQTRKGNHRHTTYTYHY